MTKFQSLKSYDTTSLAFKTVVSVGPPTHS